MSTPAVLDSALGALDEVAPELIELAEREKAIELLAAEIERTRRRVNALEHVLIPQLTETIREIGMKLEEAERGNLTRLMKVKDIIAAQEAAAESAAIESTVRLSTDSSRAAGIPIRECQGFRAHGTWERLLLVAPLHYRG